MVNTFPHGTVHKASEDLQAALRSDSRVFALWENLTSLGRNEFICWVDDAKQPKTRRRRIERTVTNCWRVRSAPAAGRAAFIALTRRQADGNRRF